MTRPLDADILPPAAAADLSGTVLVGRYRLVQLLAKGGMGAVYLAEQLLLHGRFAVKVLSPRFAHEAEYVARFLQEARAASQLGHPNIVQIVDFGRDGDIVFMVMEYLPGRDLGKLVSEVGPLPWPRLARLVLQICSALDAAHTAGLVHRDIKPSNCVVTPIAGGAELVKVVDFGIAKALEGADLVDHQGDRPHTSTGVWLGTLDYMAPEVFRGARPSPALDVYALGVLMYKLLTGELPFKALRPEMIPALDRSRPPAPSAHERAREVTPSVDALVLKALAVEPEHRFQSVKELATAVEASLQLPEEPTTLMHRPPGEPPDGSRGVTARNESRLKGWWVATLVTSTALAIVAVGVFSRPTPLPEAAPIADSNPPRLPSPTDPSPAPQTAPATAPVPTKALAREPAPPDPTPAPVREPVATPESPPSPPEATSKQATKPDPKLLERELLKLLQGVGDEGVQEYRFTFKPGRATACEHLSYMGYEEKVPARICSGGKAPKALAQAESKGALTCTIKSSAPLTVRCN